MILKLPAAKVHAVYLLLGTLLLLLPLAWRILQGPQPNKVMFVVGAVAFIELFRKGLLACLLRAWPIALMVSSYMVTNWIAPEVEEEARPYDLSAVVCTLFYALPAGVCLGYWSRHKGQGPVLLGYALFCLALALAANSLIDAWGDEQTSRHMRSEWVHANSDTEIEYLKFFAVGNVIIGIIPMTLFALASTILVLVPGWKWQKLLVVFAAAAGLYANVQAATRTTLLTVLLTLTCLIPPVVRRHSKGRGRKLGVTLACLAFAGFVVIAVLVVTSNAQYLLLLDRMSDLSDDPRKDVWNEAIGLLWRNPMGGGISKLKSEPWAHNMFLDFGLTNGFPGMLFMAAAYGSIILIVWKAIRQAGLIQEPLGLVLLAGLVASFISSLTMPPQSSFIAFSYLVAAFCLVLLRTKSTTASMLGSRNMQAHLKAPFLQPMSARTTV